MKIHIPILAIVIMLVLPAGALAQSYAINWYKVSGGGGTSAGGTYQLSGTAGQQDASASGQMHGGNYSLTGGYWAIDAVQTPGAPLLFISHIGNKAIVYWDSTVTGWTLQTNVNLTTPATWGNYLGPIVNNSTTNTPPPKNLFFRLKQ